MSFSGTVKEELAKQKLGARHCQIAEMAAIIRMCGGVSVSRNDRFLLKIQTENLFVARKYFTLLQKTFIIEVELSVRQHHGKKSGRTYHLYVKKHGDVLQILRETGIMKPDGISYMDIAEDFELTETELLRRTCCRRAFLRGAFLAAGSITNPEKSYHLEFACTMEYHAEQIRKVLRSFGIEAGMVQRKKYYVVYIKEGDGIVDVLNIMAAHQALMELENIRILKDMRNSLNRKVNCEAANIYKTVNAAVKQIEDIRYIQDTIGFEELSEGLANMAEVRLANPDATLKELGVLSSPPVGKSGVNHRLKKLSEIADGLRCCKEEKHYD